MSFLKITEVANPGGKTKRWEVTSSRDGAPLGRIMWHSPWRQYTFHPVFPTIWEEDCLREIAVFLETETANHKKGTGR